MDVQKPAQNERRENAADLARYQITTRQAFSHRAVSAVCQGDLLVNRPRPWLSSRLAADHERPRIGSVPVLFLAATSTTTRQVVADV